MQPGNTTDTLKKRLRDARNRLKSLRTGEPVMASPQAGSLAFFTLGQTTEKNTIASTVVVDSRATPTFTFATDELYEILDCPGWQFTNGVDITNWPQLTTLSCGGAFGSSVEVPVLTAPNSTITRADLDCPRARISDQCKQDSTVVNVVVGGIVGGIVGALVICGLFKCCSARRNRQAPAEARSLQTTHPSYSSAETRTAESKRSAREPLLEHRL